MDEPVEGHLRGRHPMGGGHLPELVDERAAAGQSAGPVLRHEPAGPHPGLDEGGVIVELARQQPLREGGVGNEGDAQLLGGGEHPVRFDPPVEQVVEHLIGDERNASLGERGMGGTHLARGEVADPHRANLAGLDQVRHRVGLRLDRREGPGVVDLMQVDAKRVEGGHPAADRLADAGGAPQGGPPLGRDDDVAWLLSQARERGGEHLLGAALPVDLGRIEPVDAPPQRGVDDVLHRPGGQRFPEASHHPSPVGELPAPQPDGRNLDVRAPQLSQLHDVHPSTNARSDAQVAVVNFPAREQLRRALEPLRSHLHQGAPDARQPEDEPLEGGPVQPQHHARGVGAHRRRHGLAQEQGNLPEDGPLPKLGIGLFPPIWLHVVRRAAAAQQQVERLPLLPLLQEHLPFRHRLERELPHHRLLLLRFQQGEGGVVAQQVLHHPLAVEGLHHLSHPRVPAHQLRELRPRELQQYDGPRRHHAREPGPLRDQRQLSEESPLRQLPHLAPRPILEVAHHLQGALHQGEHRGAQLALHHHRMLGGMRAHLHRLQHRREGLAPELREEGHHRHPRRGSSPFRQQFELGHGRQGGRAPHPRLHPPPEQVRQRALGPGVSRVQPQERLAHHDGPQELPAARPRQRRLLVRGHGLRLAPEPLQQLGHLLAARPIVGRRLHQLLVLGERRLQVIQRDEPRALLAMLLERVRHPPPPRIMC
ncbi:hypothetical protein STIAU_0470 [Stigmatella aurantiaca DW4/3-1]|uniref:Uncharacterized protein n=1 Tax=Stigmatella aurantiaca (strain DW4/3-1) TaxID=378806 RepID=Q096Q5_STIAD|nr:hypothetical protein STIAU_0470 [Stigmatella aurantiaca DW4/3-1]